HAARGLGHAEVAILGVTTQTQHEIPLAEMAHRERLLGAPLRHRSRRPRLDACTLARGGARPCACLLWSHRFPPPMGRGAPHPAVRYPGSPSRGIGWWRAPRVTRVWKHNATRNCRLTEIARSRTRGRPKATVTTGQPTSLTKLSCGITRHNDATGRSHYRTTTTRLPLCAGRPGASGTRGSPVF